MKVILSRKGFDSDAGCSPSPILPDGRLVSLPIPCPGDVTRYADLRLDDNRTYLDLMRELGIRRISKKPGSDQSLTENSECHLDPDIYRDVRPRPSGWKGAFGQHDIDQTHLSETGHVRKGDLFLFFGRFRLTRKTAAGLQWVPGSDRHVIFGHLQIGDILDVTGDRKVPEWLEGHPHTNQERRGFKKNAIYVATDTVSWDGGIPGAGTFQYGKDVVLTKEGMSPSRWQLPDFFREAEISYHNPDCWKDGYFQSRARGQEFVIQDNEKVESWAMDLIKNHTPV
jgi:hypothetical protein